MGQHAVGRGRRAAAVACVVAGFALVAVPVIGSASVATASAGRWWLVAQVAGLAPAAILVLVAYHVAVGGRDRTGAAR